MDLFRYFARGKHFPVFFFTLVVFLSVFNDISADCMDFIIPENSEEIKVKSDIGREGYIYIQPGNTFDYIAFQAVVSNLLTKGSSDYVLKVTKRNLLEANEFSKNQEDFKINYFIHKHSRILHKSEYTIAANTGQSQFNFSFKLSWLKGAVRTLDLNVKGGARISFNCKTPKTVKLNDSEKPLSSRNYMKTDIETRNPKNVSDISENILPKSLSPPLKNKTTSQKPKNILTSENKERENSSSHKQNLDNSSLKKESLLNTINFTENEDGSLGMLTDNQEVENESEDFFSSKFQFVIFGIGIKFFVFTMFILLVFIYMKRSKKITNDSKECTDEFKTIIVGSKSTKNEYEKPNLVSASEKDTSESNSDHFKSNEYEMENEYELPPLHLELNSQKESENQYCNQKIKNDDYVDMNAIKDRE